MKKICFWVMVISLFSACTRDVTEVTQVVGPNIFTDNYTIGDNDWIKGTDDKTGIYYYCTFNVPELTQNVFNNGILQAFLYGRNIDTLCPLPYSDFLVDDNNNQWEEHFTVEFEKGAITFILKESDHAGMLPFYTEYRFFVRLLW